MLTDNPVLVRNLHPTPALCCAQRKAEKKIPTEEDFVRSNINSFGNEIGAITNKTTSMYEVRSKYDKESEEYKTLTYRIQCGQTYQQNAIDKSKGIISKPMPKDWFDRHAVNKIEDEDRKQFYRRVMADKKPYFMRYIYPALMSQYNTYIKNANRNCMREFGMTISELSAVPLEDRSERQSEFLGYFERYVPVGTGDCVMNKICRKIENEFDNYIKRSKPASEFDYKIMRSNTGCTTKQLSSVKKLYDLYNRKIQNMVIASKYERTDKEEVALEINFIDEEFKRECLDICSNSEVLCNILLDVCYMKSATKKFVWNMCASDIINNLLRKNDGVISYLECSHDGELEFGGQKFTTKKIKLVEEIDSF